MVETAEVIGTVVALWRYPVKSMMGEELNAADLTERGVLGDRAYALLDAESGKVASAKNPRKWPNLFDHRASFVEPPHRNNAIPPVRITLPDGNMLTSDQPDIDRRLSAELGREVTLTAAAPSEPDASVLGVVQEVNIDAGVGDSAERRPKGAGLPRQLPENDHLPGVNSVVGEGDERRRTGPGTSCSRSHHRARFAPTEPRRWVRRRLSDELAKVPSSTPGAAHEIALEFEKGVLEITLLGASDPAMRPLDGSGPFVGYMDDTSEVVHRAVAGKRPACNS